MGFWVGKRLIPTCCLDVGFHRIQKGSPVRYLVHQVGINLPARSSYPTITDFFEEEVDILELQSLLLAGRLVISNQVLLSSMWYILSSWLFSKCLLSKLQRLIRNFVWGSTDFKYVRPKVAWKT